MVRTLRETKPISAILENVAGLEHRYVDDGEERITCLEFILRFLRRECPEYFFCVIPPALSCPTASGFRVRRPREYILVASQSHFHEYADEAAFGVEARRIFAALVGFTAQAMPSASEPALLSAIGSALPSADTRPRTTAVFCRCSWRAPCPQHPCSSRCHCRGDPLRFDRCAWRRRHQEAWSRLPPAQQAYSYFEDVWSTFGIDAEMRVSSPRERDLLNLRVAEHGGVAHCKNALLDISQSYGWDQWRPDGIAPTLATGSAIFSIGAGCRLTPQHLFALMGFPSTHRYEDVAPSRLTMLLGNTMHVASVGFAASTLLAMRSA